MNTASVFVVWEPGYPSLALATQSLDNFDIDCWIKYNIVRVCGSIDPELSPEDIARDYELTSDDK